MNWNFIGKILFFFGLLILIHCTYSAIQYKTFLKIIDKEYKNLPKDIIFESIFSIVISSFGVILISGKLKPITVTTEISKITYDMFNIKPNFKIFNHRKRILFKEKENKKEL